MNSRVALAVLVLRLVGPADIVEGQEPPPPGTPPQAEPPENAPPGTTASQEPTEPAKTAEPDQSTVPVSAKGRPGRFHIGPFYLTPRINIGALGFDSNVLYTPTDRQADFTASGGPELDLVLPIRGLTRLDTVGGLDYLYFARTESQRKLNGHASASLSWNTGLTEASIGERYVRTNSRLGFEVDKRVQRTSEATDVTVGRRELFGPIGLRLTAGRGHTEADQGEVYLGTDLSRTLSQRRYTLGGDLLFALTPVSSLVVQAKRDFNRFDKDEGRDANSDVLSGGIRTNALINGEILVGVRRFQTIATRQRPSARRQTVYVSLHTAMPLSPRTTLFAGYSRDIGYSAFDVEGPTPTVLGRSLVLTLTRQFTPKIDLRLTGNRSASVTDGAITVVQPDGQQVTTVRDDVAWRGGLDLGFRITERTRVGVDATYTKRNSTVDYFGIKGLLFGFTVRYLPPIVD